MKSTLELWLVRHGQTEANSEEKISGWTNTPLSILGKTQAKAIKPILAKKHFDFIWSSDLARAIDTARLAWGEPTVDKRIREMHFGDLEDKKWNSIDVSLKNSLLEFKTFEAPNGEKLSEFRNRLLNFINPLQPGRHLLFTHGGVIRMLTKDLGEDRFIKNTGIVAIDWFKRKIISTKEPS